MTKVAEDYAEIRKRMNPDVFLVPALGGGSSSSSGYKKLDDCPRPIELRTDVKAIIFWALDVQHRWPMILHPDFAPVIKWADYCLTREPIAGAPGREQYVLRDMRMPSHTKMDPNVFLKTWVIPIGM